MEKKITHELAKRSSSSPGKHQVARGSSLDHSRDVKERQDYFPRQALFVAAGKDKVLAKDGTELRSPWHSWARSECVQRPEKRGAIDWRH